MSDLQNTDERAFSFRAFVACDGAGRSELAQAWTQLLTHYRDSCPRVASENLFEGLAFSYSFGYGLQTGAVHRGLRKKKGERVDLPPNLTDEENQRATGWFQAKEVAPICGGCGRIDFTTYWLEHEIPLLASRYSYCAQDTPGW